MTSDIATFLAHAVALEHGAAERYAELADSMEVHNNKEVAELFRKLSSFSKLHLDEVKGIAAGYTLPQLRPWEYQWKDGESPESAPSDRAHYMMTPYHCLQLALFNEKKGYEYYAEQAHKATDLEVKKYAKMFAEEEAEHVVMLEKWIATVKPPQDGWDEDLDPPGDAE